MKENPKTEKHHYVSRCYLKNFTFDKKRSLVHAYQRKKSVITTNIKNIAAKKNLYTFLDKTTGKKTNIVEEMFGILEAAACPVIRKIVRTQELNLDEKEKGALAQFIAFLATRTISFDAWQKNMSIGMQKQLMVETARNKDHLKASFKRAGIEFKNEKELEDMHREETHVKELAYYKELQGKLSKQSKKEGQDAHRDWEKGTELIKESEESQEKSNAEYEMAKRESEIQEQTLQLVRDLGRRLRFFSFLTIISALVSLVCFVVALVTTTTVSLGYHIQGMFAAASATVLNLCENHGVSWEGRSILGDNRKCFFVRQLSCWVHHILVFLVAVAVQGSQLNGLFAYDSWRVRGDVLLRFAVTASILETVVFQAIPNISILPCLTLEYVRNVAIRLLSSTLQFAIQMLLLMILCGQNCSWLFDLIQFVSRTCLVWIMLMIVTVVFHFWYIEYPYALALCRRNGPLSDMTSITCEGVTLESDSLFGGNNMIASRLLDEEKGSLGSVGSTQEPSLPSHQCLETESLLTASHAEVPNTSLGSGPYSSISLGSATVSHTLQSEAVTFPPAAVSRLYEVSIQDEWFVILAHVELVLLTGVLLVVCAALPNLAAHH